MKLTDKGKKQVIDIVESAMTSKYDEIVIMQHNDALCFEHVDGNPYISAIEKTMKHYKCSWRTAEDIVVRLVGWIDQEVTNKNTGK